ncbi:hypothetical protein M758_7G020400 [Ceratodon purpureus]|uniref:Amino acid transporter transmembrane domain-containing protein n=1 Tax=Ceratodon purpureus TaxID=3225 RepID=A0A8T0H1B1_CERPU|nr:hypothetical protein KC19_7G021400 [Ceratodon purpureus]KAG0565891.1 hypothetical protein KC19_7G021400 [Ceratodon purpureus]KAG0609876.1 hypothetical protein M758_7G020400 [Ceratodon purpureus]
MQAGEIGLNPEPLAGNYGEMEEQNQRLESERNIPDPTMKGKVSRLLWHGGSVYDAWFSAASNQVAQVLLTLPTSFAQLGYPSGVIFQVFYGIMGCWACYMIAWLYMEYRTRKERQGHSFKNHVIQWFEVLDGLLGPYWRLAGLAFNCIYCLFGSVIQLIACASNIFLLNDHLDKRTWTYIFGALCMSTVFIPSFRNYRLWSFFGLIMITYTAWYMTIAALIHGQVPGVQHEGPVSKVLYFTGATNILYTFGSHAVTVEIMHAMFKPAKFKKVFLWATLYVFTLTIPSAISVYWAFGDSLLTNANSLALLPRDIARDIAVVLMLIHQFITVGFAITPLYFMWEKLIGVHQTTNLLFRALCRVPVMLPIWFLAIAFPFFGPINSTVGALLVTFTVYIIPCMAHMVYFRSAAARSSSVEKPPFFLPSWTGLYIVNIALCVYIVVIGIGFGGWASVTNFIKQIETFGVFAKCYQCPKTNAA